MYGVTSLGSTDSEYVSVGGLEYWYLRGRSNRKLQNIKHNLTHWPFTNITRTDQHGFGTDSVVEYLKMKTIGLNISERTK